MEPCKEFVQAWWQWHPPIGVYVGLLAVVGVLVPWFRGADIGKREKAFWTFLMFLFVFLEIRTLYLDRDQHDAEQALARCQQLQSFNQIAQTLGTAITNSQAQFQITMQGVQKVFDKTQQAADTATDAVNTVTGGKGFCYIQLATVDVLGKKTDRLVPTMTVRGTKILWRVNAHVVDYKAFQADTRPVEVGDVMDRDAVNTTLGDVKSGSGPIFLPIGIVTENKTEIDYLINFWALNGSWREEMHYRHFDGTLEYANRVVWMEFPPDGNTDHVKEKVVFEEISKGFPKTKGKVEWVVPLKGR
jgi:hypothetical protein